MSKDSAVKTTFGQLPIGQTYEAIHMIRKGQARWVAGDALLRQIQFIDSLFGLAA